MMEGVNEELVDDGFSGFLFRINDDAKLAQVHARTMIDKHVHGIQCSANRVDPRLPVDLSEVSVLTFMSLRMPRTVLYLWSPTMHRARGPPRN